MDILIEQSIEQSKVAILVLMAGMTVIAIHFSIQLQKLTTPLSRKLSALHREDSGILVEQDAWLSRIKQRYENLLSHVDNVDTAEFSAGEIENLPINLFNSQIAASSALSWVRQAPGVLISLGLLGTFVGLTFGLSQISGILSKEATPSQAMASLSAIIAPMGAAFQSSLAGLLLSLLVLIWSQVNGSRDCLQRCELLLSSWLETVLPQQMGAKLMTPLRQSIENLNACVTTLPLSVYTAVQESIGQAFSTKLDQIFNANASLAMEAQIAVRQLAGIANAFNESGQDFLKAANALQQSNFATALQDSVQGLIESREILAASTNSLSDKLIDVRDRLLTTQSEWKLVAKAADTELATCREAIRQIKTESLNLNETTQKLAMATEAGLEATKQLKEARLEVMRDRKSSIEVAESVRNRLATDASMIESCQALTNHLSSSLNHWNQSMEKLESMQTELMIQAVAGRKADQTYLDEQWSLMRATINQLSIQMTNELGEAIKTQKSAVNALNTPTSLALEASRQLSLQIEEIKTAVQNFNQGRYKP